MDKLEEAMERQSLKQLMEELEALEEQNQLDEGVLDWIFKRWRQGGSWKGNKYGAKQGKMIEVFITNLEEIYKAMAALNQEYPRKAKLIRGNILRAIRDLEDLLISIERGRSERDVEDEFPLK